MKQKLTRNTRIGQDKVPCQERSHMTDLCFCKANTHKIVLHTILR